VGGSAEAIQADPAALSGELQRTPTDQAGAQQGRRRDRVVEIVEGKGVCRVGDYMRGEAAVAAVAGEDRPVAEILLVGGAIGTDPAGVAEPGNADAPARAPAR